ncbi:Hypothetical Protein FCC1311_010592 [Hondaea fermentalgiana]|uniref:Major facilitator superfamily (MFS) profile domain-containing protein n=1 Tax=Hondaea fermentalgiana TaxID=2315210 RepID=A0A2R5G9U0_9STRA|nr:Hypothetical Protein FCC1311_010592 [Hondaea fermentalgiana]|eukprot:GBG24841.1 Hypothetical Protein FCC1311_010592 [Hondaea fermentalgiana]
MGLNQNVQLALLFAFLMSASRGVWAFTTLSVYLREITGSSADVGLAEGLQGIAMAATAVLAGLGADATQKRDRLLHVAGAVGLVATACSMAALLVPDLSDRGRFWALTVGLCAQGAFQGISTTCIDTLFADSVETGQRSKFNTYRFALIQLSSVSGPIICVFLFYHYGNSWTRARLTLVFMVGLSLMTIPICLLFFFSERYALGDESESHYIPSTPGGSSAHYQRLVDEVLEAEAEQRRSQTPPINSSTVPASFSSSSGSINNNERSDQIDDDEPYALAAVHGTRGLPMNFRQDFVMDDERGNRATPLLAQRIVVPSSCGGFLGQQHIPTILIVSDVISALGSGMTVKFFPLFFKIRLGLSPVAVNLVYIALPIFMTAVSLASRRAAKRLGRIQTCIVLSLLGCTSLAGLGFFADATQPSVHAILGIYMLSTVQHSSRPLRKAVLMDYVEKARRARFNSIDSVTRLNWSGSAFLGGLAIDRSGFGRLFFVTAIVQALSTLLLFALLPLVPIHESRRRTVPDEDPDEEDLLAEMEDSTMTVVTAHRR